MPIPTTASQTTLANSPTPRILRASDSDVECPPPKDCSEEEQSLPDIEHVPVTDDPRKWSRARKACDNLRAALASTMTLWIVSAATMISGLASNIQNPTNALIEADLHASSVEISWTLAAFIIVQGNFPLIWSAASEIKGRKPIYLAASTIFVLACGVLANAPTIKVLIGMRVLQAAGSSAAIAISAATLADIYETHERGTMMGAFFAAPLLGPALGPILGGSLSHSFGWRASFYFLVACGGIILVAFLFLFKDTFRLERSLTYQVALRRRANNPERLKPSSDSTVAEPEPSKDASDVKVLSPLGSQDLTHDTHAPKPQPALADISLSLTDINPFPPLWKIVQRRNNLAILLANGLVFAFSYCLSYTCTRTLSSHYDYDALTIGLVLLSLGVGTFILRSVGGSVIGGRWSDHVILKMKAQNDGKWYAEMRLHSATLAMFWLPPCVVGYAWVVEKHLHIAAVCVMLFLSGFFSIWMYTSTVAYLVDANMGRSCSAVATNSSFRGTLAFISTMIAVPLQDVLGDGVLYTGFAGLLIIMELLILLVLHKGASWREDCEKRDELASH
ncbi:MFS general substrate transporter [Gyrodon lividus]|nr:MFS general substrate transporter [Gyrodon lividus]